MGQDKKCVICKMTCEPDKNEAKINKRFDSLFQNLEEVKLILSVLDMNPRSSEISKTIEEPDKQNRKLFC